jgi:hypothetical protein
MIYRSSNFTQFRFADVNPIIKVHDLNSSFSSSLTDLLPPCSVAFPSKSILFGTRADKERAEMQRRQPGDSGDHPVDFPCSFDRPRSSFPVESLESHESITFSRSSQSNLLVGHYVLSFWVKVCAVEVRAAAPQTDGRTDGRTDDIIVEWATKRAAKRRGEMTIKHQTLPLQKQQIHLCKQHKS